MSKTNTVTKITSKAAQQYVDQINELHESNAENTAELAFMLDHFFSSELHIVLGYYTVMQAEQELFPFGAHRTRVLRHLGLYSQELGYNIDQLSFMVANTHSYGRLVYELRNMDKKKDVRSVVNVCNSNSDDRLEQFNVTLNKTEARLANKVLKACGMEVNQRRENFRGAYMEMVRLAADKLKIS